MVYKPRWWKQNETERDETRWWHQEDDSDEKKGMLPPIKEGQILESDIIKAKKQEDRSTRASKRKRPFATTYIEYIVV